MFTEQRYPHQHPDEHIVFYLRRHWFVFAKTVLFYAVLILFPYLFYRMTINISPEILTGPVSLPLIIIGASIYYLFIWLFFFHAFADYYLDVWIVTDHRIINIEQQGLFSRITSEHELPKIQDVTSEVHGIFPTILLYGNVHIQTAGTETRFSFEEVPNAAKVARNIQKQVRLCQAHNHVATSNIPHSTPK